MELGFADVISGDKCGSGERKKKDGTELKGLMFSRAAVTNSLLDKLIPKQREGMVPVEQLEKRLDLLAH